MKVSNETKVGALTALAITVLILGFNFLKGKNITDRNHTLYAVFPDVEGLVVASPVVANGLQVGRVYELDALDENMKGILVTINLAKNINIPVNSYATLSRTLLGTTSVKLMLGNSTEWVKEGDTLQAKSTPDLLTNVKNSLDPAMQNINNTLAALETVIQKLNNVLDPKTQNNLQSLIANLNNSSASLTALLNVQKGKLAQSLDHVEKITGTLASNKEQIDATLHHLEDITEKMAQANLK
ncbi:MAG: MlaD family protein, partial [Chitinophagaceae bacterium]